MLIVVRDDDLAAVAVVGEGGAGDLAAVLVHVFVADDQIVGVDGINTVVVFVGEGDDRPALDPPATANARDPAAQGTHSTQIQGERSADTTDAMQLEVCVVGDVRVELEKGAVDTIELVGEVDDPW